MKEKKEKRKFSEEHKNKLSLAKKGKKHSLEHIEKIRQAHIGKKHSKETINKILQTRSWYRPSLETKKKISNSHIGIMLGEKSPNWKGGVSFGEYTTNWTNSLRNSIRERDGFICQECGFSQEEIGEFNRNLDVHHIDYNKSNLNPNNLITLCRSCHQKTNFNKEYWINHFN